MPISETTILSKTIPCETCAQTYNAKMHHCPFCNATTRRDTATAVEAACPRCQAPLEEDDYRGSVIDICTKCSGLWLDMPEYDFHTSERDVYADPSIGREFVKQGYPSQEGYLPCVRCQKLMNRINYRRLSGVMIDVCKQHGAWFDAGELEQIRTFIANGGIEQSQDRQILHNREAIQHHASQIKDTKFFIKYLNKWNPRKILLGDF